MRRSVTGVARIWLANCLLLLAGGLWLVPPTLGASKRPNFLFILSDDLAQGDLGCYGQKLIQTPHLNRMAREGTRYLQAYCGTSVCAPSRASLLTGLHSGHCPIRANREIQPEGQKPLPEGTFTVARLLKDQGYATACIGKWGMGMFDTPGSPLNVGFDHFYGYNCQRHAHSYFPTYLYNDAERFPLPGNDGKGIGQTYAQELIAAETLRWIREHKDEPFFLFYSVTLPHGRYEIDNLGEYANRDWTDQQKSYAAMVTRLDSDIGRLLDLLRELDLAENTLVITSGDNGSSFNPNSEIGRRFDQTMGGKLRGFKRGMYEGALRQAAIAWQPGTVSAGRVTEEPWAFWDYLPTVAELIGVELPDSRSRTQFAVAINQQRHPEIYRLGKAQREAPAERDVSIEGVRRARWVPVARSQRGDPKVSGSYTPALLRTVTTDGQERLEVLVAVDGDDPETVPGQCVVEARSFEENRHHQIGMRLNDEGAERMFEITSRYQPGADPTSRTGLAVILDGEVHAVSVVLATIKHELVISGNFDEREAKAIAEGLAHPTPLTDGHSLVEFLKGGSAPEREYFYWELHEGTSLQAARFGDWKAVRTGPDRPIELYDLASDEREAHDLAGEHPAEVARAEEIFATARTDHPDWPLRTQAPRRRAGNR